MKILKNATVVAIVTILAIGCQKANDIQKDDLENARPAVSPNGYSTAGPNPD